MSALFRAELAGLMRLVATHNAAQREARAYQNTPQNRTRAAPLIAAAQRAEKINRAAALAALKKFASQRAPISANKLSELSGLADDTARKHLRDLAENGEIVASVSPTGKVVRYYAKEGKA